MPYFRCCAALVPSIYMMSKCTSQKQNKKLLEGFTYLQYNENTIENLLAWLGFCKSISESTWVLRFSIQFQYVQSSCTLVPQSETQWDEISQSQAISILNQTKFSAPIYPTSVEMLTALSTHEAPFYRVNNDGSVSDTCTDSTTRSAQSALSIRLRQDKRQNWKGFTVKCWRNPSNNDW